MYSFNDLNSIFIISEKDVENNDKFKFMRDHKYIIIKCKIDFHGIQCIGHFTFASAEKLSSIMLIPTNEWLSYESNDDVYPDENYEIAVRNKVEPILNKVYGEKIKIGDPWLESDGYEWPSNDYHIRIMRTLAGSNYQGGKISIWPKNRK